ncbi:hypothetical protein ACTA71_012348 [Dictyostelium dimigraforme]
MPFAESDFICKLFCPWSALKNQLPVNEEEHLQWLRETDLFNGDEFALLEYFRVNKTYMNLYLCPLNPPENMYWMNRLHDFFYIVDDFYFEKNLLGKKWVMNLFKRNGEHDKIQKIFWDIASEIEKTSNPDSFQYFLDTGRKWSMAVFSYNKAAINSKSTFLEYSKTRFIDIGVEFALSTAKLFVPPLDPIFENHEIYQEILFKKAQIILTINDISSYPREISHDRLGNYVKVHAYQTGSIQCGLDYCKKVGEQLMDDIEKLSIQLKQIFQNSKELDFHINLIKLLIANNNECSFDENYPRYNIHL